MWLPIRDYGSFLAAAETSSPRGTQSLTGEYGFNGGPTPGLKPGSIGRSDATLEGPLFHGRAGFRGDVLFHGSGGSGTREIPLFALKAAPFGMTPDD